MTIHLINPLWNLNGGSEQRTLSLARQLMQKSKITVWRLKGRRHTTYAGIPTKPLNLGLLSFPREGTIIFVGVYFEYGFWLQFCKPKRVVIIYNTPDRDRLDSRIEYVKKTTGLDPELVFASRQMQLEAGMTGVVHSSPIDTDRFKKISGRNANSLFTVGRLSRPDSYKHHMGDIDFYKKLIGHGSAVKIMGASNEIIDGLLGEINFDILPAGSIPPEDFLRSLDCFYYRTADEWPEPYGRVIAEAMSCSLPVVIERRCGISSIINDGVNGFTFDSPERAFSDIETLRNNNLIASQIGAAARQTILQSSFDSQSDMDFYI